MTIAVLDSGIKWRATGDMADLATKARINLGEAKPPCWRSVGNGDCNGDGAFDIRDFGAIADRNGNGLADPEDLILDPTYSDGRDDDHNGYVDDVSGWDFLYGDNDPLDTVEYGHGTGEAKDSTAAEDGQGDVGNCPRCQFLPVRVSDSFIADGGRFAAGVLFALDSGADVVQEALGAISNPRQAQQAIDAAHERGVVVVASMADEASKHPNLPASLERTMAVNSVTERTADPLGGGAVQGYLALNGCTNFGGHTFVAVPSDSCSSEATGQSAGMVGLLESYAREVGVRPARSALAHGGRHRSGDNVLSADEAMQIVRSTADDVDFATPNAVDPANNYGTPTGNPLLDTVRYPTTPGWDATFGYGRVNAYEMLKAVQGWPDPTRGPARHPDVVRPPAGEGPGGRPWPGRGRPGDVLRLPRRVGPRPPAAGASGHRHLAGRGLRAQPPIAQVGSPRHPRPRAGGRRAAGEWDGHADRRHGGEPARRGAVHGAPPRRRDGARRRRGRPDRRVPEAGVRPRRSRPRGRLPEGDRRRGHVEPVVRRRRRRRSKRAAGRHRRR